MIDVYGTFCLPTVQRCFSVRAAKPCARPEATRGWTPSAASAANVNRPRRRGDCDMVEERMDHHASSDDLVRIQSPLIELLSALENRQHGGPPERYLPTGFRDLDALLGGLGRGDLIVVAARPSMGKTAFALNIAAYLGLEHNLPVGYYGLETSPEALVERVLCTEARVSSIRLRTGALRDDDAARLVRAAGLLSNSPIWVYASNARQSHALLASMRRLAQAEGVQLLIVDGLQAVAPAGDDDGREFRPQTLATFTRGLKALALELNIPIVLTSTIGPYPDQRVYGARRPQFADLRDSPSVDQDADVVMFLYRQDFYDGPVDKDGTDIQGRAEVIVGKQRNGPTGIVDLIFTAHHARFDNLVNKPV
jgi:replicative DNA helicase